MNREDQLYDRCLFLEIIESYESIKFLRSDSRDDIHVQCFEGLTGKFVQIDTTDLNEDLTFYEAIGILTDLGIGDIIDSLFPNDQGLTEDQEMAVLESDILKEQALKGLND